LKTLASIVALVALIALSPLVASAQGTIPDNSKIVRPGLTPYSPGTITPADSIAHLNSGTYPFSTLETVPPGTQIYYYPAVIQNRWCGGDVPDSVCCFPATGATRWYLDLSATFHATTIDSQAVYVVGLSVRNSSTGSSDSLTVTGWLCNSNPGAPDSIGSIPRTINQVIGQAGKCLPSERVLVLGGQPGSKMFRIPLYSPSCGWWNGDNIGIRLRPVAGSLTSGTLITASIPCVQWTATLRGYR
jgi:hypothetical protein